MRQSALLHPSLPEVRRLGLASRGNTHQTREDIHLAIERGINYLNWCGYADGMSEAVAQLGRERSKVVVAVQIEALDSDTMAREVDRALKLLKTDYLDVVTFYYLETAEEWKTIRGRDGALARLHKERESGRVRVIGITSHQRKLAAKVAASGEVDLLMIRYNAAHRGAEKDIFPTTDRMNIPTIAYTCLRWGALIRPVEGDREEVPTAPDCYRYVLSNPSVSVAIMAPDNREELIEDLSLLEDWRALTEDELLRFNSWGDRVRATAGAFP